MNATPARQAERSANIFISYRREDSGGHAGRLFDGLSDHFSGRLFMDVDTLEPGVDFVEAIEKAVGFCEVLIVVIGREWLTLTDASGRRRLDNPGDFVRLEVEHALARNIRVIPVLVEDAPMPRGEELPPSLARLARRNAIELSDARWAYDVDRLAQAIRDVLGEEGAPAPQPAPGKRRDTPPQAPPASIARPRPRRLVLASVALLSMTALATGGWIGGKALQGDSPAEVPTAGRGGSDPPPTPVVPGPGPESGEAIGVAARGQTAEPPSSPWPADRTRQRSTAKAARFRAARGEFPSGRGLADGAGHDHLAAGRRQSGQVHHGRRRPLRARRRPEGIPLRAAAPGPDLSSRGAVPRGRRSMVSACGQLGQGLSDLRRALDQCGGGRGAARACQPRQSARGGLHPGPVVTLDRQGKLANLRERWKRRQDSSR